MTVIVRAASAFFCRHHAALVTFVCAAFLATHASALPSFAIQTDQPCSACHVGAFGPRLKQQGRDFKLYGYTANDTKDHGLPISFVAEASFTHTSKDELANVAAGYNANNNVSFNELGAFYAGKIAGKIGAFIEVTYDAIEKSFHWEDFDLRYADETKLSGHDVVYGVSLNNAPTVTDMWEVAPGWAFPFETSPLANTPSATTLMEALPGTVMGPGAYGMFDDTLYLEGDLYQGLDKSVRRFLGAEPFNGSDRLSGPAFYWRAVLQHDFDAGEHYLSLGTNGLVADVDPNALTAFGSDHYTDTGIDATYQWLPHPELSTSDMFEAHILYLRESEELTASRVSAGTKSSDALSQFHVDLTYDFGATFTPTVQYFTTWGTNDAARWGTAGGSPDSAGWIAQLDYVPWGKPDAPLSWLNGRISLQYVAYTKFDGQTFGASDNNTLFLNFTVGAAANR